jgi:hypothetical protein
MVAPLRHRQTKEAETDMFDLQPPRHISTLHKAAEANASDLRQLSKGVAEVHGRTASAAFEANDPYVTGANFCCDAQYPPDSKRTDT